MSPSPETDPLWPDQLRMAAIVWEIQGASGVDIFVAEDPPGEFEDEAIYVRADSAPDTPASPVLPDDDHPILLALREAVASELESCGYRDEDGLLCYADGEEWFAKQISDKIKPLLGASPVLGDEERERPPKTFAELRDKFVDPEKEQLRAELKRLRDRCTHADTTLNGDGTMTCDLCGLTEPDPFAAQGEERA